MKLIVKHLLETAMRKNRVVEQNEVPLVNFFVTFENIMSHGLRVRKKFTGHQHWQRLLACAGTGLPAEARSSGVV